eukprot:gene17905-36584_t
MTRSDAREVLAKWGDPEPFRRAAVVNPNSPIGWILPRPGSTVFVYCDIDGCVASIEFASPGHGVAGADRVTFDGTDLFLPTADEVVAELVRKGHIVEHGANGDETTLPEVLLALWRDGEPYDSPSGLPAYFESALIARPGYFN